MDNDRDISELVWRLGKLEGRVRSLEQLNEQLLRENIKLKAENVALKERLIKKNSRNSSKPPSTEIAPPRRTKSLRKPSGRKPGGQPGHKGSGLKMVSDPDVIDERTPHFCNGCGSELSDLPMLLEGKRQLIDIPPIRPVITEQRVYSCTCTCGHTTKADFTANANAAVGYGEGVEGLVAYLHARQYLPVARMKELMNDLLGIPISTGGICHLLDRFAQKTTPVYQTIKERLLQKKCVGSDETGCKVDGKLNWFWTWQSEGLTFIAHSPKRGSDIIDALFPEGFPNGILVSDAWKAHLKTFAKGHQLCTAHMMRELNYHKELKADDQWSRRFADLLNRALELRRAVETGPYKDHTLERDTIMTRFDELLDDPPDKQRFKKAHSFHKRMLKNRDHIFPFLFYLEVPPDNNASERAIRNIKVKQKVSGQFKAAKGAQVFAQIRSVIDTTQKNSRNLMDALKLIARGDLSETELALL